MAEQKHAACLLVGKIRRFIAVHFRKKYVARQLDTRQGDCRQCGICCNLWIACPLLTKDKLCLVYRSYRPKSCRLFPLDQKDIDEVASCGGSCGYRFDAPPARTKPSPPSPPRKPAGR